MAFAVILTLPATAKSENSKTSYPDNHAQDVVVLFVKKPVATFPDRSEQYKQAVAQDNARAEQARLEAARQAELARVVNTPTPQQNTPQTALSGSCVDWLRQAGVEDISNALILINRESGCNPNSINRSSGACGIPQALPCSKLGTSDPVKQIIWMNNYVLNRYGSWASAVSHSNSMGWY